MAAEPFIPEYITVHLGPPDSPAQNVTVPFPDYIKNVASSEIYPTWPENAIRANIYAQISYALNRIYTEWYRSMGYDFDITNSTAYDQSYVPNRDTYDNINRIVDEVFNSYVRKQGSIEPYFTQYCNGTTVVCEGLSQWGTVPLAEQGLTPYEILQTYYGEDIDIVKEAPVRINTPSYPGIPLRLGSSGGDVEEKQLQLNRISRNYPSIPKIYPVNGVFDQNMEEAVKTFQRLFGLTPDGVIGEATWYRIAYLYTAVKRLAELDSEGVALSEIPQQFPEVLRLGDSGKYVQVFQYYLAVIGGFYENVPPIEVTGTFDEQTQDAVIAFQKAFGLEPDGIVGRETWNEIYKAYRGIVAEVPQLQEGVALYPGYILTVGSRGEYVSLLQQYLTYISQTYPSIPAVPETGVFGNQTQTSVKAFQQQFGLEPTGNVNAVTWYRITDIYGDLINGYNKRLGQYPGYELGEQEAAT